MNKILLGLSLLVAQGVWAEQIPPGPGETFGSNYNEKHSPEPEDTTWGWNDDSDYHVPVTYRTDRFKGPSNSPGIRIHVNKGTPIRIDNDILKIKEPPDVNSGFGTEIGKP